MRRIIWWLFRRNKHCKSFCPTCKWYDRCRLDVSAEQKEVKMKLGEKIVLFIVCHLGYCKDRKYCHNCKLERFCFTLMGRKYLIGKERH